MLFGESAYYGNIWIAQFEMPGIGVEINQHQHEYDHVSLLTSGSVAVSINDGPETIYNAPSIILIRKNFDHKVRSLSDDTLWYCIFALRDIDGNVIDEFNEDNMPKINPMLMGTQSSLSYKILYEELLQEINDLKLKYINVELERNFLKKRILEEIKNINVIIPIKDDGSTGTGSVVFTNNDK
jgi:hypothetical protein